MQFKNILVATAVFATSALAEVKLTATTYAGIAVGVPFNISYTGAVGPVTLTLQNGPSTNLKDVQTIDSGLPTGSGSFVWTPSASLPADTYAIKVSDGTTTNYGTQFELVGATASSSGSTASSTGSSTATSSGSSSSGSATTTSSGSSTTSTGVSTTSSGNSTVTSASTTTSSKTSSKSGSSSTSPAASSSTTSAPGGNSASGLASPLAMVLLAFAAVLSLN